MKKAKKKSKLINEAAGMRKLDFANRLSLLQDEAGRLGLFKTMHILHEASRAAGFELTDILLVARRKKP